MQSAVPENLSEVMQAAIVEAVSQLQARLTGTVVSPRLKMLDLEQVMAATGLGKSTIYKMIDEGLFPKPQRNVGKNIWRESALIAWAERNDPNREGGN
jgi:prophage regulatory protein